MTLARQLILSGFGVLIGLFIGMISFMVINTQQFLNAQLSENSQETANVLGLSLTTVMKNKDTVFAARMVDSIWDAGYYKQIKVQALDGTLWVNKEQAVTFDGVPYWFVNTIPLTTQAKKAVVQSGWMQIGKVTVESNPGFAYKQIWQTTVDSVIWLGFISVIAGLLGSILLYIILKPLRAITKQANEICNQQFSIVEPLPRTFDLRHVVEAMNKMSRKLQSIFEENARQSLELQNQAYQNPVTQLGNRRYFDLQFDYLLRDKEHFAFGVLLLLEISNFKLLNENLGYQAGDRLLKQIADFIKIVTVSIDNAIVAHLGGANFAIVLPKKTKEEGVQVARAITQRFIEIQRTYQDQSIGIGLCLIVENKTASELLTQADTALRQAQFQLPNSWYFSEQAKIQTQEVMSASQWVVFFKNVIEKQDITLYYQNYRIFEADAKQEEKQYCEVLLRLKDNKNNLISAGVFMPIAERLSLMPELDKLVISAIVDKIKKQTKDNLAQARYYSINISPGSLENNDFIKWLLEKIHTLGKSAQYIIIELPEYGVIMRIQQINDLYKKLTQLGCQTAIDHYGKGFSSFAYLQSLRVNFLKIDGSYISKIEDSKENQFFVHSLINIAHTLDIKVIAESVETQAEFDMVCKLKVDGVQGYFVGRPQAE